MIGKYTFKENGVIVGESYNLITTAGRKAIIDYMAGYTARLAGGLVVGIGTLAATLSDKTLQFEVGRCPVDLSAADYANNAVVFKGQLPAELECTIYEVGAKTLPTSSAMYDSQLLLDFNSSDTFSAGTLSPTNSRLGQALNITAAASTTTTSVISNIFYDLSGYGPSDQFTLIYRANNAFVSNLTMRFKTDSSNYYAVSFGAPTSGTYAIISFNKSVPVANGSPDWGNITSVEFSVTATSGGTASIDIDGLRVEDRDSNREEDVLVSRSVLGTPVTKTIGIPLDIEYAITL